MAVASAAAAVAVAVAPPASQSSLLQRHHSALVPNLLCSSPRASSWYRSVAFVSSAPCLSLRQPTTHLAATDPDAGNIEVELGGGGPEGSDRGFGGGAGGGNGKSGGGDPAEREGGESDKEKKGENKGGMSMSQKLTLSYAALVGVGGIMGYVKSGSQKSLASGGISALLLYYVYIQLPVRPAFASSLGLGLSAALLAVMGSRFKKSGKIFPAGVVSLVSFIMAGGYFHGILRSSHV
ncbi:protein FATTY ACID EXPORT 2, chloroplastic [Canna indica]|uniref:Protein FATTY ACID EXPORT 2, chloroplastic n=1 Tax=Canna indica TaxID=4628 RepID=A0AAQ3JTC6_9LILI|nr:protein FATTY ACID EXPORT 2, chloroplastic [Canna indica]